MSAQTLEIRRSSASVWGSRTGMRSRPDRLQVHRHDDLHRLQGLRGGVPVEWNDLRARCDQQTGTYQTLPTLRRRVLEPDPVQRAATSTAASSG